MKKRSALVLSTALTSSALFLGIGTVDAATKTATVINAHHLNMRATPSATAKIVTVLDKGNTVTVLNDSGSWDYIQFGNKKGYVNDKYLKQNGTSTSVSGSTTSSVGTVANASTLNLRQYANANSNSKILAVMKKGEKVSVLRKTGTWYQVKYKNTTGYVNGKYLAVSTSGSSSPTPTPTPTTPPKESTPILSNTYKVVKGDTLYGISKTHNLTVQNLKTLNGLTSDVIKVGQILKVTGSTTVTPAPTTPTIPVKKKLTGKHVVLDPGHASNRVGARGNDLKEEVINWDMVQRIKAILEENGAKVTLTRTQNTDCAGPTLPYASDLACRPQVAEKLKADAFVSIHFNAGVSTANGTESFYYHPNDVALAKQVLSDYIKETGLRYRRVEYANYAVLRNSPKVPSTLVELAFITNPTEAAQFKTESFKNKAAKGIAQGIENYLLK